MTPSYLRRAETLVNELSVTVQGDENSIVDFNATLLNSLPEIEAIGRKPTDDNPGDATVKLKFRPPCLLSIQSEHGRKWLEKLVQSYRLDVQSLRAVSKARAPNC